MEIWLDTIDFDCIEKAKQMGILHGITTNPSIASKAKWPLENLLGKLLEAQSGPVTAQVTADRAEAMIRQAKALFSLSKRIIVKIPVTPEGLIAISALSKEGMPVMATAVFDPNQILLAARAGAQYIAPYFSRICESEIGGIETVKGMMRLVHHYQFPSKIIAASLHSAEQIKQCLELGTHAVTLNEKVFSLFIEENPFTRQALQRFEKDWEKAPRSLTLPF